MNLLSSEKLMIVLIILVIMMIAAFIVDAIQKRKLYRRYDIFMRGKDAESLEDMIMDIAATTDKLKSQDMATRDLLMVLSRGISRSIQKTSVVKYNALPGMGGQSSFVLAMLDQQDTGFLLNAMHSRSSFYLYIKEVTQGQAESELSKEEKTALALAMVKKSKYFSDSEAAKELSYEKMTENVVRSEKENAGRR